MIDFIIKMIYFINSFNYYNKPVAYSSHYE